MPHPRNHPHTSTCKNHDRCDYSIADDWGDSDDFYTANPFGKRAATRHQRLELIAAWLFFLLLVAFIFAVLAR